MSDGAQASGGHAAAPASQRLDKWLWCARLAKTRTQAAALVTGGKIRLNRAKTDKPSQSVRKGDVITASLGPKVKVLRVTALAERRGSAALARELFEDLTAPVDPDAATEASARLSARRPAGREPGSGRPTKRDRRLIDRLKGES